MAGNTVYVQGSYVDVHDNDVVNLSIDKAGQVRVEQTQGDAESKGIDRDLLTQAIENCQAYFWGNSAYAVVFCICRDDLDMEPNKSSFETMWRVCRIANNGRTLVLRIRLPLLSPIILYIMTISIIGMAKTPWRAS